MEAVYHSKPPESMVFSRFKDILDARRMPDEIVIPVGDSYRVIGWTLMPVGEYARWRYDKRRISH